ncbi:MAG: class I SAM-dependent methyltransferase [Hyphomicrobiales bacterium]|nr:class I SAM-dependent methyltransferase [Alphaproteobacteria bacterium]
MPVSAARRVQRELLDELAADDPRAVHSRRDLNRVNTWMLQPGIMARWLLRHHAGAAPRTLLDLGSGDGAFILRVARILAPRWPGVAVTMLDRQDIVSAKTRRGFDALGWSANLVNADLFGALEDGALPAADVATANLFLHHFTDQQLGELLPRVARLAPLFVACEPRRAALPHVATRMLWVIGCNGVTLHDARVSVEAGFTGRELSGLWPEPGRWRLHEQAAPPFSHGFAARRLEAVHDT